MKFWLIFSAVPCQYSLLELKSNESSLLQTPLWQVVTVDVRNSHLETETPSMPTHQNII